VPNRQQRFIVDGRPCVHPGEKLATQQDKFPAFPRDVVSRTPQHRAEYKLSTDLYALRESGAESRAADDVVAILNDGDHTIVVFRGPLAERGAMKRDVVPVYTLQPGGMPAVPTGLVFISFKEGIAANTRRPEIERAGYVIEKELDYAPQAAWLKAQSGKVEDALAGVAALEQIGDLVTIEPQMLIPRASR
jgi:hypothetical protein